MQAEALYTNRSVPQYEDFVEDVCEPLKPGLGTKLALMYKHKGGACAKVRKVRLLHVLTAAN